MIENFKILVFGQRLINWIAGLMSTSSSGILANDLPGAPLRNRRGLGQGDLLSPMLFILLFGSPTMLFALVASRGLLSPLAHSGLSQHLSIFADNVMIFIKQREEEMRTCTAIMETFAMAFGFHVNFLNTSAMLIRCFDERGNKSATYLSVH